MATRMQQRKGTATQWTTANPILNAGEIGWESDTNKFKIGDGTNHWDDLTYFLDADALGGSIDDYVPLTQKNVANGVAELDANVNVLTRTGVVFEGATADSYETTLQVTDPTADRTITLPDSSGTIALTSDIAELSQDAIDAALTAGTGITKTYNDGANTLTLAVDTSTIQAKVSGVSDTEIGYLDGVTSAIQTQLNAKASLSGATFTGAVSGTDLTLSGNLTVNGTTTNINSTNLVVEDKNVVLGDTTTPTDTTADGGGITLKGTTDKTFNWVDATDSWTSSEHINLASGKSYYMNGTALKDVTETLTGKTISGASNTLTVRIANDVSGLGTGIATALAVNTESAGAPVLFNGALGTPSSGTLTNATGLPISGLTSSTTAALGLGSIELGHATDTTIARGSAGVVTIEGVNVVTTSSTDTLTNKTLSSAILTGSLTAGGATGSSGQVLASTGSGVQWSTPAQGAAFSEFMLIGA